MAEAPTTTEYDWAAEVAAIEGPPEDEIAYEFSTGRKFISPQDAGGVYVEE